MDNKNQSDQALLEMWGIRIAQSRLNQNMTQETLAREAGVSLPTIQRIESGASTQTTNLIRILRALGLLDNLEQLIPEQGESPIAQLKLKGKSRKRASSERNLKVSEEQWRWGDEV